MVSNNIFSEISIYQDGKQLGIKEDFHNLEENINVN